MSLKKTEQLKYSHEQLVDIIAKVMSYGANHYDDEWRASNDGDNSFKIAMEAVSMCVACWLAQNTIFGSDGVEWEIVYNDLIESKWDDPIKKFEAIAEDRINLFGGVKPID